MGGRREEDRTGKRKKSQRESRDRNREADKRKWEMDAPKKEVGLRQSRILKMLRIGNNK